MPQPRMPCRRVSHTPTTRAGSISCCHFSRSKSEPPCLLQLERSGEARSSAIGPLVEEAQQLLSRLPAWSGRQAGGTAAFHAEQLALDALLSGAADAQQEERSSSQVGCRLAD